MKNVIITGATGMVGSLVLKECLNNPEIRKVTSVVRRASGVKHKKLTEVIHNDFLNFSGIKSHFKKIDIAYYCLGVYTGQVPKDEFKKITFDITRAFGDILKKESENAVICLLSGQGADSSEKSRIAFARYKGMAENYIISRKLGGVYIFRPGYIYPVSPRKESNLTYRLIRKIYPLLKKIYADGVITSEELAHVIFTVGIKGYNKVILKNRDMKKYLNQKPL